MKKLFIVVSLIMLFFFYGCNNPKVAPTFANYSIQSTDVPGEISLNVEANQANAHIFYLIIDKGDYQPTFQEIETAECAEEIIVRKHGSAIHSLSETVTLTPNQEYTVFVILKLNGIYNDVIRQTEVLTKEEETSNENGTGTSEDPFKIRTVEDLANIMTGDFKADAYYILMADLDLAEAGFDQTNPWVPLGKQEEAEPVFSGVFDGNNHTISNLYLVNSTDEQAWGLFSELGTNGVIKNLHIQNVSIVSSGARVGSLVGYSRGTIENVSATQGNIVINTVADAQVGGIVGVVYETGSIQKAFTNVEIFTSGRRAGGIAGSVDVSDTSTKNILIKDAYALGNIKGTSSDARQLGGIVGYARSVDIENVYYAGTIEGTREIGGIAAFMQRRNTTAFTDQPSLKNSFYCGAKLVASEGEKVGALIGALSTSNNTNAIIMNNFNAKGIEISGEKTILSGQSETSITNFKDENWFSTNLPSFDFDSTWEFKENSLRPVLIGMEDDGSSLPDLPDGGDETGEEPNLELFPSGGIREAITENDPRILQKVYVSTVSALQSKAKNLTPGTAVIIEDGIYHNVTLSPESNGTEENPIFYIARNPGQVKLTGDVRIEIKGSYNIVSGLELSSGSPKYSSGAIVFRGNHNRVNNVLVKDFNGTYTKSNWVTINGQYNEVDNCTFIGKNHQGPLVNIQREEDTPNYHYLHHNHFKDFSSGNGENEWETIRLGTSETSRSSSYCTIENNLFERTNGEIEVISIKACENIIKGNTFIEVEGLLTLRHGIKNIVENNIFLTNGITDGGGIRIFDGKHIIRNNYIEGVNTSDDYRGGIILHSGNNAIGSTTSKSGQWTAFDVVIENNTIINSKRSFVFNARYSNAPANITFKNNFIFTSSQIVINDKPLVNSTYENEHYFGGPLGLPETPGITHSPSTPETKVVNGLTLHNDFGAKDLTPLTSDTAGVLY